MGEAVKAKPVCEIHGPKKVELYRGRIRHRCGPCAVELERRKREQNPEANRARLRAWKQNNPERVREQDRRRYQKPQRRAQQIADALRWKQNNPEKTRQINRAMAARRKSAMRPYSVTQRDLRRLWHRQDRACAYCRAPIVMRGCHQDHVIPLARGGAHSIGNIVLACAPCNLSKGAKLPIKWYYERRYSSLGPTLRNLAPEHAEVA